MKVTTYIEVTFYVYLYTANFWLWLMKIVSELSLGLRMPYM